MGFLEGRSSEKEDISYGGGYSGPAGASIWKIDGHRLTVRTGIIRYFGGAAALTGFSGGDGGVPVAGSQGTEIRPSAGGWIICVNLLCPAFLAFEWVSERM